MDFTAHTRVTGNKTERQTVDIHCRNVADLSARYADIVGLPSLARLQGILHDLGKFCVDFDEYINQLNNMQKGSIDHCFAGAKYLLELADQSGDNLKKEVAMIIAHTIISHHGLHDWIDCDGADYRSERTEKTDRYDEIRKNIEERFPKEELLALLESAAKEYQEIKRKIIQIGSNGCDLSTQAGKQHMLTKTAFYFGLLERLLESILVDADRTDTADFVLNRKTEFDLNFDPWDAPLMRIEDKNKEFLALNRKKRDSICALRCDISERSRQYANEKHGICRMVVPTGGGKTLSSLRFALHYCKNHNKDRIFYIAPFMSILEQNSDVWKEITGGDIFIEHHSNAMAELQSAEELQQYELRAEKWDKPVIATTLVQFLNTLFSGRMDSVRRMHRLCNSVIIIDEVQSVPAKCVNMFNLAMNFLSRIGNSCIVLCSATQPVFEHTEYEILLDRKNESMTGNYQMDFCRLKRNNLVMEKKTGGYTYDEAACYCREKLDEKGSVLFIVNTKKAALELYKRLKITVDKDCDVIHLSTYLCPESRRGKINKMKQDLSSGKRVVCVTTQLIEAGVDVSFPCVIRSVAGLDNIVQAAGRCNRNGEWGECCDVYLIFLKEERIEMLGDISIGQKITNEMMINDSFLDLLNTETMRMYYEKYYRMRKGELSYIVNDFGEHTTLIKLLSMNASRRSLCQDPKGNLWYLSQAFKTAGQMFRVIADQTVPVLVPYDNAAEELILKTETDMPVWEQFQLLRKAQKYVISIYPGMEKELLKAGAIRKTPCGLYVLKKEFYDPDIGIDLNGKEMDLLCF